MSHPCCICWRDSKHQPGPYGFGQYCSIHRTYRPATDVAMDIARGHLSAGGDLKLAAREARTSPEDIDLSLWKAFGGARITRSERKAYRPSSMFSGRMSMPDILEEISKKHRISQASILGPSRKRPIAHARQHAMFEMAQQDHLSLPMIGQFLGGRDHTTVLHGVRAHKARVASEVSAEAA